MKYILIAIFSIGLMGIIFQENIRNFNKQKKHEKSVLEQETKNGEIQIAFINDMHAELKNNKCYLDDLGFSSGMGDVTDLVRLDSFYISYSPVIYYCMKKTDPKSGSFSGHDILQMNVVFVDRSSNVLNERELDAFKETLRNVKKTIHDLNGSKGLKYSFNDYDIISPYTIATVRGSSYSLREIEVIKDLIAKQEKLNN